MHAMSNTAATILTAIAGGLFTLGTATIGYRGGRRQTTDQAGVEHGQWLRGQRQEAYVQFLEQWEKALTEYKEMEDPISSAPYDPERSSYPGNFDEAEYNAYYGATQKPLDDVRPFLERVIILGPAQVERAADVLNTTLVEIRQTLLRELADSPEASSQWRDFREAVSRAPEQRQMFVKAARDAMRTAPRPGGG